MKWQSDKRRKLMRDVSSDRESFRGRFPYCWCCGAVPAGIHEILRGGSRGVALSEPSTWFAACWCCNSGELNDAKIWPVQRQLAVKFIEDRGAFDLERFLSLKREGPASITFGDLKIWILKERKARE